MGKLKLNLPANDAKFLTVVTGLLAALTTLALFDSPPGKVPSVDILTAAINKFRQHMEAGRTGNRIEIALRNMARKEVTEILQKIFHYLESVADDDDLIALQQAGFELHKAAKKRSISKSATSNATAEQQGGVIPTPG